eukprot:2423919-Pyramimonas_sp.AAC.1
MPPAVEKTAAAHQQGQARGPNAFCGPRELSEQAERAKQAAWLYVRTGGDPSASQPLVGRLPWGAWALMMGWPWRRLCPAPFYVDWWGS